jgi:GTP-binding protein
VPLNETLLTSARFAISVAESEQLNAARLLMVPEVAFVGRSNAGKSSAINVLAQQRQLAFASKTPGRTQLLNFFELTERIDGAEFVRGYLVDLPGYGFAKVDEATRQRWDLLIGGYLQTRRLLAGVVVVIDARRGIQPIDEVLFDLAQARERPERLRLHLLLTKADQLGTAEKRAVQRAAEARAETLPMPTSVQLFSALKREGVTELRETVLQMLESPPS